ncbi:MAG: methionyl-tRNA formyltransferase, partial [Pseudomonadota bacterium]|nr:methionyl-tRNA formyltransferase [Pseudomonadota bacterium]
MRLAFMGTPDFALPTLDALAAAGHDIAAVYCQPPRPAGRGQQERLAPVHTRAVDLGLPVRTPTSLKTAEAQAAFAALDLDAAVVVAYGLILPPAILAAPRLGCLNVHASLLPRWRGAAPIQRAIAAGDDETGISLMVMEAGLDTGPVLRTRRVALDDSITGGDLHDQLATLGG